MNRLIRKLWKKARAKRGSTIVGVLAAMVFITLVTSFMVKNTGAQSAASVGYGTAMTMQSTVSSGIMATEAVLANPATNAAVVKAITDVRNNVSNIFIPNLATADKKMVPLGNGQFFSSKLLKCPSEGAGNTGSATVEINSGIKNNGKGLRRALAFYKIGNLSNTPTIVYDSSITKSCDPAVPPPDPPPTGSENAVYMAGSLRDGNNGMEVIGGATFEDEVRFQNKKAVFYGEAFFQKDVYFLADAGYVFYGNTYFNANVTFQNQKPGHQHFRDTLLAGNTSRTYPSVGVNKNITAFSTILIPGNFYINGNFEANGNKIQKNALNGNSAERKAYITGNFTDASSKLQNYTIDQSASNNNSNIPIKMGIKSLEERRETPLVTYDELVKKIKGQVGDNIRSHTTVLATSGEAKLDVNRLTSAFITDSLAGKLYEGHVVVLINYSQKWDEFKAHGLNGVTFEKKVIFLVNSGTIASNGSFYCSSPASSTMIYLGENGRLQDFGSKCLFRGYIYIDEKNTSTDNGFYWDNGSSIEGAFHNFSTNQFKWNYNGNDGKPTKITYNAAVLAPFNTLKKGYVAGSGPGGSGGGGSTTVTVDNCVTKTTYIPRSSGTGSLTVDNTSNGLNPVVKGYYFY